MNLTLSPAAGMWHPTFYDLNYPAIFVATIVGFALGAFWFTPEVFGNRWMTALGKTSEDMRRPGPAFAVSFFATLLTATIISRMIWAFNIHSGLGGIKVAFYLAFGIYGMQTLSDAMFSNVPLRSWRLQAGYRIVMMLVMGAILGTWR